MNGLAHFRFRRPGQAGAIVAAAAVAGACDLTFALGFWGLRGAGPARVLQSVSAGLVGWTAARSGGLATAALGLALFALICLGAAAAYLLALRALPGLARRPVASGLAFGALANLFLHDVVGRLSAAHLTTGPIGLRLVTLAGCAVCFGIPLAVTASALLPGEHEGVIAAPRRWLRPATAAGGPGSRAA